jgi:hypothetical protein
MNYVLGICDDCGNIDFDFNLCGEDDSNKEVCKNKVLCHKSDNIMNKRYILRKRYIYDNYVVPNLRYLRRMEDASKLFLTIEWMIDNIDKENTEIFEEAIEYIYSCGRLKKV